MKKIMGLAISATLLIVLVVGGTWAYFQDTESSEGNYFVAGTLDLTLNTASGVVDALFEVENVAPGYTGTATAALANIGSIDGDLTIAIGTVANTPGSGGTEFEGGSGELGANLDVAMYLDLDDSGTWNTADIGLAADGTTYENTDGNVDLVYVKADSLSAKSWAKKYELAAGDSVDLVIDWKVATTVGNEIQGDKVSFDLNFTLDQVTS